MRIAATLEHKGEHADRAWVLIARLLERQGVDPSWRSWPSTLDQLRGWQVCPGKPRRDRAASIQASALN